MVKKIEGYTLLENIGSGCYGQVFKAKHITNVGYFAVKVINNQTLTENPKIEECFLNEVRILSKLGQCENIVKFHELIRTKNNHYFIYDYCNGGTLHDKIKSQSKLCEKQAMGYFKQILSAFRLLNKYKVIHRDLKPQNILFHNQQLKVADFGLCKSLKQEQSMTKTMVGSPIYMAPQILKSQPYTSKADIWSLGVILFEMLYGYCPYLSSSIAELTNNIQQNAVKFPEQPQVSQKTKSIIKSMLTKDHFRRVSWVQLFGEYFTQKSEKIERHPLNLRNPSLCLITEKSSNLQLEKGQCEKENKTCFNSAKYMKFMTNQTAEPEKSADIQIATFNLKLQLIHQLFLKSKSLIEKSILDKNLEEFSVIICFLKQIKYKLQEADFFLQTKIGKQYEEFQNLQTMMKYQIIGLNKTIDHFARSKFFMSSRERQVEEVDEEYSQFCKQIQKISFSK